MLPTEDLFVYVYVLVDNAISSRAIAIARRRGPAPACSNAKLLTVALVRRLLGRRSQAGFLAEVARDWAHLFPRLPHQSEADRRIRWLWGAFEQLRAMLAARLPEDNCQQVIRPPRRSSTPPGSAARTAGPAWATSWLPGSAATPRTRNGFYGFRLVIKADLGSRVIRACHTPHPMRR
jgi:hypothetical protein